MDAQLSNVKFVLATKLSSWPTSVFAGTGFTLGLSTTKRTPLWLAYLGSMPGQHLPFSTGQGDFLLEGAFEVP